MWQSSSEDLFRMLCTQSGMLVHCVENEPSCNRHAETSDTFQNTGDLRSYFEYLLLALVVAKPVLDVLAVTIDPVNLGANGVKALLNGTIEALYESKLARSCRVTWRSSEECNYEPWCPWKQRTAPHPLAVPRCRSWKWSA